MRKIFKYPLKVEDVQMIEMPKGAAILTVQAQQEIPCIWAEVDPDAPPVKRCFTTYGTGHRVEEIKARSYVGTYQLKGGALVFHVFTDRIEYPKDKGEPLCGKCGDTGIEDTGNHALPCGCVASLTAKFSVAGVEGSVTGAEMIQHLLNHSPDPMTAGDFDAMRKGRRRNRQGR